MITARQKFGTLCLVATLAIQAGCATMSEPAPDRGLDAGSAASGSQLQTTLPPNTNPVEFRGQNAAPIPAANGQNFNGLPAAPYNAQPAAPYNAQPNPAGNNVGNNVAAPQDPAGGFNQIFDRPPVADPNGEQPEIIGEDYQLMPDNFADMDVFLEDTRTGRFMFGVGVNSEAGVTGQIVIDERNFDWRKPPSSFRDFINGQAFRGGGQGFRIEALPGSRVQRYLVNFTEPYLFDTPISFGLSGFFYNRRFVDWDEQRMGVRPSLGYRLNHDLSLGFAARAESINISNPRVGSVPELNSIIGDNNLYSGRVTLTHDTRDVPFAPTEGHLFELSFEQVFGDFDFSRGDIDFRKYYLIRERPDGSGRHTLAYLLRLGITGSDTPIFENYFAGGFSTMRGFDFRGASPISSVGGVQVGGELRFLGSLEYTFPLTADDMLKGALFCDFGTVEEQVEINGDNFRVAPGFGLRISIPALGPAPLALDFAFPIAKADTDETQIFSFFFGFGR